MDPQIVMKYKVKPQHIVYQHGRYKPCILEAEAGLSGILAQPELQSEMSECVCVGGGGWLSIISYVVATYGI